MKKTLLFLALAATSYTTQAQTPQLAYDIYPGLEGSDPNQLTVFNGKLYFAAKDTNYGAKLFVLDNTTVPKAVDEIYSSTAIDFYNSYNNKMGVFNGKLYFAGNDGVHGMELMSYDGISAPTLVADIDPGISYSNPFWMRGIGNRLYFSAYTDATGHELWIYDGINPPVVKDINSGPDDSYPDHFIEYKNKVYFVAKNAAAGSKLFVYDPATGSVTAANTGTTAGISLSNVGNLIVSGSKLYFTATTYPDGLELYSFDGTTVIRVTDVGSGFVNGVPGAPFAYKDAIYFAGDTAGNNNTQLYKYDTASGITSLVYEINPGGRANPKLGTVYNSRLYFVATTSTTGSELWEYDGTKPPSLIADIYPGITSSEISDFQVYNGKLYFNATANYGNYELYSLTTTPPNTVIQSLQLPGEVTLSPNPTSSTATLRLELHQHQRCSLSLTDAAGKTIWSMPITDYSTGSHSITLPLDGNAAGLYFYHLNNEKGTPLATGRIVKQ